MMRLRQSTALSDSEDIDLMQVNPMASIDDLRCRVSVIPLVPHGSDELC